MTPSVSDCALGVTGPRRPFLWLGRRVEFPSFSPLGQPVRVGVRTSTSPWVHSAASPRRRTANTGSWHHFVTPRRGVPYPRRAPGPAIPLHPTLLGQGNLFTQDCRGRPAACRSIPIRQVDRSTCLPRPASHPPASPTQSEEDPVERSTPPRKRARRSGPPGPTRGSDRAKSS